MHEKLKPPRSCRLTQDCSSKRMGGIPIFAQCPGAAREDGFAQRRKDRQLQKCHVTAVPAATVGPSSGLPARRLHRQRARRLSRLQMCRRDGAKWLPGGMAGAKAVAHAFQCVDRNSSLRKNANASASIRRWADARSTPAGSMQMSGASFVSCCEQGDRKT